MTNYAAKSIHSLEISIAGASASEDQRNALACICSMSSSSSLLVPRRGGPVFGALKRWALVLERGKEVVGKKAC